MSVTSRLSSKGQVVIPKEVREALQWKPGHELVIDVTESGVLLRSAARKKAGLRLEELRGFISYDGPPLPIEELCEPVDYNADWQEPEKRGK